MRPFLALLAAITVFLLGQIVIQIFVVAIEFQPQSLGALGGTIFIAARAWGMFWVSRQVYKSIAQNQKTAEEHQTLPITKSVSGSDLFEQLIREIREFPAKEPAADSLKESVLSLAKTTRQELTLHLTNREITPDVMAANLFANQAGDELETGEHHLYRGVLTPFGTKLLRFYTSHMESQARLGNVPAEWAADQISTMKANLKNVG